MKAPGVITLCTFLLVLAAACGATGGREEVIATGAPVMAQAATTVPPTTVPSTTTTEATTTTSEATVDSTPTSPNEPGLPAGARHGDQPEVVEHFDHIAGDGDCDDLRTERDSDRMARDHYMEERAADPGARGKAEVADRWMQAANGRMRTLRCPQAMAFTP